MNQKEKGMGSGIKELNFLKYCLFFKWPPICELYSYILFYMKYQSGLIIIIRTWPRSVLDQGLLDQGSWIKELKFLNYCLFFKWPPICELYSYILFYMKYQSGLIIIRTWPRSVLDQGLWTRGSGSNQNIIFCQLNVMSPKTVRLEHSEWYNAPKFGGSIC